MPYPLSRRGFLQASALTAGASLLGAADAGKGRKFPGTLIINDDGHVFPYMNDDLTKEDLRRYLESYCRNGVDAVAFCVGDMSWPTMHPTKVGVHYHEMSAGQDQKLIRMRKNLDTLSSEPGGYFGETFRILKALGKKALGSFRMNDAHFTTPDNPNASPFWKKHAELSLGPAYGYYGGCLNYASDEVRAHFYERVIEFAELYPEIDGIDLDAMRSPFFFLPDKGAECAPLFTDLVRKIKTALAEQAKKLNRTDYLLTINIPRTPELALESGLDAVTWDAEGLFDCISIGTYQTCMDLPIGMWKERLSQSTPVFEYINCSVQTGQYLGLEEYRAAAANAYGAGADGVCLFNYPCLFELASQIPEDAKRLSMKLPDARSVRQPDFSKVGQALDEIGNAKTLRGKDKRFLFFFSSDTGYRHYSPVLPGIDRSLQGASLKATFNCFEDFKGTRAIALKFKIENVSRTEQFLITFNGKNFPEDRLRLRYAANGRDTRVHTVALGPYLEFDLSMQPEDFHRGENTIEATPVNLLAELRGMINLVEIEVIEKWG
jgi:hypothetical protein